MVFPIPTAQYPDGMRYRGRTIGFSLDNNSRLLVAARRWSDSGGRFYELSFHHANIEQYSLSEGRQYPLAGAGDHQHGRGAGDACPSDG